MRAAAGRGPGHVVCIDDPRCFGTHKLHLAAADAAPAACSKLLSHSPYANRDSALAGFSLMLDGHAHGGQDFLQGGVPVLGNSSAPRSGARSAWQPSGMAGGTLASYGTPIVDMQFKGPPEITRHPRPRR
jgi:predicted MPP superfamily phosphohydrolase